jgi:cardiolipin synthase
MATRLRVISFAWAWARLPLGPTRRRNAAQPLGKGPSRVYCDCSSAAGERRLSIPNLITLARILSVPVMVWAIVTGWMLAAFLLFLAAGVSDAVDGYLAKRFGMTSDLGAYLDPLADKALIVTIYVTLGISGNIPLWLVILVVSRDVMIVAAVLLSWVVDKPVPMKPLLVSKLNTVAQILFAGVVLGSLGLGFVADRLIAVLMGAVTLLTLGSVAAYVREWVRHMGADEAVG